MEQPAVQSVPASKGTLAVVLDKLQQYQTPSKLDHKAPENIQKGTEYEHKARHLFGNSQELLTDFGLEKDQAEQLSRSLQSGDWMFDRDFLLGKEDPTSVIFHEPRTVSPDRQRSGKEPFDFKEVPTVELQFKLSSMIKSAVRSANLKPSVAETVMKGYSNLTRYDDFGVSLQFPAEEDIGTSNSGNAMRLITIQRQVGDCYKNAQSNAIIMGGWTSGIDFARREDDPVNGPKNESDLSQQYLARKQTERKSAFVFSCAGPGMEENVFTEAVTPDNPFGPRDHMLGAATAYTLLGRTDAMEARELSIQGHSMSGAGAAAAVQHYSFPSNYNVSFSIEHPAIKGTNAWTNPADQTTNPHTPLFETIGMKVLPQMVAGGVNVMNEAADALHVTPVFEPVKKTVSGFLTRKLFLAGDEKNMPALVDRHLENFAGYTDNSTFTAWGSVEDFPLDPDKLEAVMRDPGNPVKFTFMADKDDQMVKTGKILPQLPPDVPLFVLDDRDEGSHYAFKRNCRAMRIGLLQQSMEQLSKPQFRYLHQELFMNVYQEKPQSAQDIGAMFEREADKIGPLFGVTKEELQTYVQKREKMEGMLAQRPARPFIKSLVDVGLGEENDLRSYFESVADKTDFGLHYFYAQPDRLSRAVMPENTNPGLGKVELMIEALEQLRDQVHFNLPSDPLLNLQ